MIAMTAIFDQFPKFEKGWVWLAGAGSGDLGLLTLHAYHALSQAEVVVSDALINPQILSLVSKDAHLVYAGKRGGKPSASQQDISAQLVSFAQQGYKVLRLKGGDPYVFGRGGEEALHLVRHSVPFRVIPGVTAGIAGLSYVGIPVTHRETNSAVTFITGHSLNGTLPDNLNWTALAQGSPTLVFYMAYKHLALITEKLIAAGRDRDEPAAIVTKASLPEMQFLRSTLGEIVADIQNSKLEPPSIIVFGQVVRLHDGLDWLGAMAGKKLDPDPLAQFLNRSDGS